jgi:ATP-dependent helicase/nuclease subunit A
MSVLGDAEARALALAEFERPVVIEAGAGTGKTRTLVARIGSWLLGPGWERADGELRRERSARGAPAPAADEVAARAAEGVVAITFTDAAAAEMAHRVGSVLGEVAAGGHARDLEAPPPGLDGVEAARRAARLAGAAGRLRISTIHGFCHRLLAELPLEAGLHPGFRVDAEGELLEELATRTIVERLRAGDERVVALLAGGIDPPALLETVRKLAAAGVRPEEILSDPFGTGALAPLFRDLEHSLAEVGRLAAPLLGARRRVASIAAGLEALDTVRARLAELAPSATGLQALVEVLGEARDAAGKVLDDWARDRFGATEQESLGAGVEALRRAAAALAEAWSALSDLDPELWARASAALRPLLAQLRGRLRAEGVLSFDDLLERAAQLVGRRGVRARVRRGLRQLLVDEFQDTDRRQCELLRQLVLAGPEDESRPGLFVVGDPQQSIYGWRSADLGAYFDFVAELRAAGASFGRLDVNFRSAPPVLAEVERALAPALTELAGLQASFQPLVACPERARDHGFTAAGRAPVEYWAAWDRDLERAGQPTPAARATELEAAAVAREVRELVDGGHARYRDFAVLLRSRGDLESYLDALRRAGAPYAVQKDRSYYRRREVVDAAAALRAILDPSDLLALVAFLRSPFVGVPDAAWLPLWRAGFPAAMIGLEDEESVARARASVLEAAREEPGAEAAGSPARWCPSLLDAVAAIAALRREFRSLPLPVWIERFRSRLLLEPVAAARFLGRFGVANLERFLAQAEERLGGEADPGRALAALRRAVAEVPAAEEARPPESEADAVSVMTIHTAKGLQFRQVYLVQARRQPGGPGRNELPLVDVGPPGPARELCLLGAPTPGWRALRARRAEVAAYEAGRVLYVALTRAQDRLVVSGAWERDDDARARGAPSFADLLTARLDPASLPSHDRPRTTDAWGVPWRLVQEVAPAAAGPARGAAADPREPAGRAPGADEISAARRRSARARVERITEHVRRGAAGGAVAPRPGAGASEATVSPLGAAFGTAVHRVLERLGPELADAAEVARAALEHAPPGLDPERLAAGLARFLDGPLGERRRALLDHELGRELPLVLGGGAGGDESATGALVGVIDLLYRDPESGETVIADYKTDELRSESEAAERVARYAPQLRLYGEAVRSALGLARPPRLELWLLALDRVEVVPPADPAAR